jgi:hypothetical protein
MDYAQHRVLEYLVFVVDEKRLRWFDLHKNSELFPDTEGIIKLQHFPGLWIDQHALLAKDHPQVNAVLQRGLATAEHREFVQRLAANRI